jgi:hypothetical protein
MTLLGFLVVAATLGGGTFAALAVGRHYRAGRTASVNEASVGAWRYRASIPAVPGHPFAPFMSLDLGHVSDVMEGSDEGFEVAYFEMRVRRRSHAPIPAAIVQLPVHAPSVSLSEGQHPPHEVGPRTADEIRQMGGMRLTIVPSALFLRSEHLPAVVVQRTALRLARAIVADAREQPPALQG